MVIFLNFFLSSISTPPTSFIVSAITFTVSCVLQLMRLTYKAGSLTWLKMMNVLSINLWKNSWSSMPKFPGKIYCHILATHNVRHFLALAEVQIIVQPMIFCVCGHCFSRKPRKRAATFKPSRSSKGEKSRKAETEKSKNNIPNGAKAMWVLLRPMRSAGQSFPKVYRYRFKTWLCTLSASQKTDGCVFRYCLVYKMLKMFYSITWHTWAILKK